MAAPDGASLLSHTSPLAQLITGGDGSRKRNQGRPVWCTSRATPSSSPLPPCAGHRRPSTPAPLGVLAWLSLGRPAAMVASLRRSQCVPVQVPEGALFGEVVQAVRDALAGKHIGWLVIDEPLQGLRGKVV